MLVFGPRVEVDVKETVSFYPTFTDTILSHI